MKKILDNAKNKRYNPNHTATILRATKPGNIFQSIHWALFLTKRKG